jgi:hypothetical protein
MRLDSALNLEMISLGTPAGAMSAYQDLASIFR